MQSCKYFQRNYLPYYIGHQYFYKNDKEVIPFDVLQDELKGGWELVM